MPLRVYYLDDEVDLLEVFSDLFSAHDIEITTFDRAEAVLAAISHAPPDLVFLDYRLPNTTGDEIASMIAPSIPKVLISGDLSLVVKSKFEGFFEKPYDHAKIQLFLKSFMQRIKESA